MKGKWLVLFLTLGTALLFVTGAQAVHELSFQLDGDTAASTTTNKGGQLQSFDWDSFFNAAGQPTSTLPDAAHPGYTASSFVRDFRTNPGCSLTGTGTFCTSDSSTFATGSKDTLDITPGWQCTFSNNVNSKTDISNVYATAYTDSATGHKYIYFALERNDNSGDGNVAFWFLQDDVGCSSTVSGSNVPFTGHHMDGDILVVSSFSNGGAVSNVSAYKWVGTGASGFLNTTAFATGADCKTVGAGDQTCATVNVPNITTPWLTANKNDGASHTLRESEFFEGGLDLTGTNLADRCFSSFLGDTRTSTSPTSTIFDYAGSSFQHCNATIGIAPSAVNGVGATHTFTVTIGTSNAGTPAPAPDGTKATVTLTAAGNAFVSNLVDNCATTGTVNGTCTVSFTSNGVGTVTAHAASDVNVQGQTIHVETSGAHGNSGDAVKRFVDANVSIAQSAVNEVRHQHVFTITTNALPSAGTTPTLTSITPSVSGSPSSSTNTCTAQGIVFSNGGLTATCTLTINSTSAGTFTANATAIWSFADGDAGANPATAVVTRSTDGTHGSSGPATKRYVDARLTLSPLTATNEVGHAHTITATLSQDDGLTTAQGGDLANGFGPAPDGTTVTFSLPTNTPGATFVNGNTCTTSGGTCSVQINSGTAGNVNIHATTTFLVGGISLTRATGDGLSGDSADANKHYADMRISITGTKTNEVGQPHTFTVTVQTNDGTGWANAAGAKPAVTISPAPGTKTDNCASTGTSAATGTCTVVINSSTPTGFTANAAVTLTVGGLSLTRDTDSATPTPCGDNQSSCGPAVKTYADAYITISPGAATNPVGATHTYTASVFVSNGTGNYTAAPDGTTVSFAFVGAHVGSFLAGSTCTTTNGSCTIQTTSSAAGQDTMSASTTLLVGGVSITRTTGTAAPGHANSDNALKTWVKAKISIATSATNEVGQPHTFTATVSTDSGSGYQPVGAGTPCTITLTASNGANPQPAGPITGNTNSNGQCSVTFTSASAGKVTGHASATVSIGGQNVTVQTTGTGDNSADAVKTFVDATIAITPQTAANPVGTNHTLTGQVKIDKGDGAGLVNAPDGTTISFSLTNSSGASATFVGPSSCATSGGTCTVVISSPTAGTTTIHASTSITVGGVALSRATGDTRAGDSPDATKNWGSAKISIASSATNEVGQPHTFTVTLQKSTGSTFVPAPGEHVNVTLADSSGAQHTAPTGSCTNAGPNTDANGQCTITFSSPTAGKVTGHASATLNVGGATITVQTDGVNGDSPDAVKTYVDANIQIDPLQATNEVGTPHTFTAHVNVNSGSGFANAPDGTLVSFTIVSGPGSLGSPTCTTSGGTGNCSVTLTSSTAGVTLLKASTNVTVGGLSLARSTGDTNANDSANANKTWVDANIQIDPLQATNEVGTPHTFTAHVNVNTGSGFVNAPNGTTINFTVVSGPGSLSAPSCTTNGGTGSCSVNLTSATAGVTVLRASTDVTVGGLLLHRATGDTNAGDSANANKTWVDANIQIDPLTATNEVGTPHTFTAHVNVNTGSGFANAPNGTTINFTVVGGPGSLSPTSCTTSGGTGNCSVSLTSSTAGVTVLNASTNVTVGGLLLHRATGDTNANDSANANKTWVDANIQIDPLTATNEVGTPHTFTAHVNVNTGSGFTNAPNGTVVSFTIVSGPGGLGSPTCTTSGGTGNCSVTLTSSTAGVTVLKAATTVNVGGLLLTRATGDTNAGDSANANKTWVDANIQIDPLTATNEVGTPHTFTAHVNVNTGSGFTNAPNGTLVSFTIVSGPGSLGSPTCTTSGGTGNCSVTLTSSTAGVTVLKASTTVNVGGLSLSRSTGDTNAGDSANANKTWVDANIQISPLTADNPIGTNHVLTVHVNINAGSGGYVSAPDGTTITASLTNSGGATATFVGGSSCTTGTGPPGPGTGSCQVTISSPTAGTTTIRATTTVTVGGVPLTRTTGDTHSGDSLDATKNWIKTSVVTNQEFIPQDTATLSGAYGTPTGSVTFQLFQDSSTCSTNQVYSQTVPLSGGSATTTNGGVLGGGFTATGNHTWYWKATYSGDGNNSGNSSCVESTQIQDQ